MSGTDHVQLFDDAQKTKRTHILSWPQQWPPWERLVLVTGKQTGVTGMVKVPEGIDELSASCIMDGSTLNDVYFVAYYRRDSYSQLPEDLGPNVSRGAAYIKEDS